MAASTAAGFGAVHDHHQAMKLYSSWLSPYAARCRAQIYVKGIEVEIVDMPGAPKPPELYARNPIGKVPTLVADGLVLAESEVICAYIEELHPEPPLLPPEPAERARVRLLSRIADLYVMPAVFDLFPLAGAARRDPDAVRTIFQRIEAGLGHLEHFVGSGRYFVGDALTLADCALVPHLAFIGWFLPLFADEAVPADHPELMSRVRAGRTDEHVARVLGEMERAFEVLRERLEKRTRPPGPGAGSPGKAGGDGPRPAVDRDGRKQA